MEQQSPTPPGDVIVPERGDLPVYGPPAVTSYGDEELLDALGPGQARAY